jgi:2-polyprenyl-3-methyl-5-hydroxy-6-metoxy-1,4-benzoquinol methylase
LNRYQDRWCRGVVTQRGERPCGDRFAVIADYLNPAPPFTVLDLGANLGYFSMRLADRFHDYGITVTAVEWHHFDLLDEAVRENGDDRVTPVKERIDRQFLNALPAYDVILALSVLHHLDLPFSEALDILRRKSPRVIVELATEPNACGQHRVGEQYIPEGAVMLGEFPSHLGGTRPLFVA